MSIQILTIAPDVSQILSTFDALMDVFDEGELGFCCTVCGQPGDLSNQQPAAVIILIHDGATAPPLLRLAHAWCSESGVRVLTDATTLDIAPIWPGVAWLRPPPAQPEAVLLIGPHATTVNPRSPEDVDRLHTPLLERGFTPLTDPHAPIPDPGGLTAHITPGGQVRIWDRHARPLWDDTPVMPLGWADTARRTGRVGMIVTAGCYLHFPWSDHLADLHTATVDGAAVAATAHLLTDTDTP